MSAGSQTEMEGDGDDISLPKPASRYLVICGAQIRKPSELEPLEKAFLAFGIVSLIATLGLTIERLANSQKGTNDYLFAFLLLVNLWFVMYYVIHGVFMERPFEILVSVVTVVIVMGYCIIDYATNPKTGSIKNNKLIRLIIVCLLGPINICLGLAVAWKFFEGPGNLMFRLVGANVELQRICKIYQIFTAFMGFGLQLVVILLVLIAIDDPKSLSLTEKLVIGIGVPMSCIATFIGRLGARLENATMIYGFLAFCIAMPAYIIYLFDKFGKLLEKANSAENGKKIIFASIIAAGAVGFVVQLVLIGLTVTVRRNFGKGLRARLYQTEEEQPVGQGQNVRQE